MSDETSGDDQNPETTEPDSGSSTEPGSDSSTDSDSDSDGGSNEDFPGSDDPSQISDDQLPEDLRPTDDNPLAKPVDEDDDGEGGMNLQEQAGDAGPPA